MSVYALLVGVDTYLVPMAPPLPGTRRDVALLAALLGKLAPDAAVRTLVGEAATRDAVVSTFREHLGAAGPGDVALFAFSGHGSREPVPPEMAALEPDGYLESLVCHDSRVNGVPDLVDKEVAALAGDVAAGGARVVLLFDACHSAGASKDLDVVARAAPPALAPRTAPFLVPLAAHAAPYATIAACESEQVAAEVHGPDGWQGAFTEAVLDVLAAYGPELSLEHLAVLAGARLAARRLDQRPVVRAEPALAAQSLLGEPADAGIVATARQGSLVLAAGAVHGIVVGDELAATSLVGGPGGRAKVRSVEPGTAIAAPDDWTPVELEAYAVDVVAGRGRARVAVGGAQRDLVVAALSTARVVQRSAGFVVDAGAEALSLWRRSGELLADGLPATEAGARRLAAAVEHVRRWDVLAASAGEPGGPVVRLDVTPADGDQPYEPVDGEIRVADRPFLVRLTSEHSALVCCGLVDLTPAYAVQVASLPEPWLAPGASTVAFGGPIRLTSPDGAAVPRDRLVLMASESAFDVGLLAQPALADVLAEKAASAKAVTSEPAGRWSAHSVVLVGGHA
jgi:hypothetical protein